MKKYQSKNLGMSLFVAVVIMAVLLFVTFAVVNIAIKGSIFASSARDSQFAFFAADAGLECAIYWDSISEISKFDPATPGNSINCAGQALATGNAINGTSTATLIGGGGANTVSTFGFKLFNSNASPSEYCAIVTVEKRASDTRTYIKSRGYNTCESSARRIERGIEVDYPTP